MMKKILTLLFFSFPILIFGQFSDDFSDGNFTENPVWMGDTGQYMINEDFQLQLFDNEASTAVLYTSQKQLEETEWSFWVKLKFSPSSNNYARVYLASDNHSFDVIQNAVYVQLGESGSDDAITLYKVENGAESEICKGTAGLISSSFDLHLKVSVDANHIWRIFVDLNNTGDYLLEAQGEATLDFQSQYFMIYSKYTVSNSAKFYFDDIEVKNLEVDQTPPILESIQVLNEKQLIVKFSEIVDKNTAENIDNYTLLPNIHPSQAQRLSEHPDEVMLTFTDSFENNTAYTLEVKGITDLSENEMTLSSLNFIYLQPFSPNLYDVVINEVMADVNPEPQGLPPYDYVELYNKTEQLFDLSGYTLKWGNQEKVFPENTQIQPHDFLLVTDEDANFPNAEHVVTFSSFPINNEALLSLSNKNGELIHAIHYDKNWYHDKDKEDGGWAIEMIDTSNPCGGENNYKASENLNGGTPGFANSVMGENPDNVAPELKSIQIIDSKTLALFFSETMDMSVIMEANNYLLQPNNIAPNVITSDENEYNKVEIHFENEVFTGEGNIFTLQLTTPFVDCAGNPLYESEVSFSNYTPKYSDIIITEIMADVLPEPRDLQPYEYIELYNRTDYPIDLSGYILHTKSKELIFEQGTYIPKKEYLAVSESRLVLPIYNVVMDNLSISNEEDELYLESPDHEIIHYVTYKRDWFDNEMKAEGGWSLEMIDINNWCGENENWSASASQAGGTPGKENSIADVLDDVFAPDVLRVIYIDETHVEVVFNEAMHIEGLDDVEAYSITPNDIGITQINPVKPAYKKVLLTFDRPLQDNVLYHLEVTGTVKDCSGNNIITAEHLVFSKPIIPQKEDVVINEIMFNAADDGIDFLEIYNLSNQSIDLSALTLCLADEMTGEIEKEVQITEDKAVFPPNTYLAITKDKSVLLQKHPTTSYRNVFENEKTPNYNSTEGLVLLKNIEGMVLDSLYYHEDFHYGLINDDKGISLERIDPTAANIKENWHSAAENVGFATPGYENSQYYKHQISETEINIQPKIISPNNDGKDDVAVISFNVNKPGYSANIIIYDAFGRSLKTLANNYLSGNNNQVYWDGTDDRNHRVPIGHYIVYIEFFDLGGQRQTYKKTLVVSEN